MLARRILIGVIISASVPSIARGQARTALNSASVSISLLNRAANLIVEDVSLAEALIELTHSSGVVIAFSPSLLPNRDRGVSCYCGQRTVAEALDQLFLDSSVGYAEMNGQVVVFRKASSETLPFARVTDVHLASTDELRVPRLSEPRLLVHAAQGSIAGRVTDMATGDGLPGASVVIDGTDLGALTDEGGQYLIAGVPVGQVTVSVDLIGYVQASQTVRVDEGSATTLNFRLESAPVALEQIVVTATGEQRLREIGNAIGQVQADSVVQTAPVSNLSELLSGRVAGVVVQTFSGTSVGRSRIRIRGSSSPSLSNEPLVYIDGVRVNTDPSSISFATNGQVPSRFNDINPENIESIDIIKGPSAATLYGTEAANGVILITTKSGTPDGRTTWHFWAEAARITEPNEYPANYEAFDSEGAPCPLTSVAAGLCTQSELRSFNLIQNPSTTVFKPGARAALGASVAGTAAEVSYFVSGEFESEDGVYDLDDGVEKLNLRANFTVRPTQILDIQVNTGYVSSNLRLFTEGGSGLGPVANALAGRASPDGWFQYSPEQLKQIDTNQRVERFIGSTTMRLQPLDGLMIRGVLGMDAITREDERLFPVGIFTGTRAQGSRQSGRNQTLGYTAELLARFDYSLTEAISATSSVGSQYFRSRARELFSEGQGLVPGSNSLATAARTTTREGTTESRSLGIFIDQQFGYEDRLFVSAGLRADDNSTFGRQFDAVIYPKLSASWVVSDEDFFPFGEYVNSFRVRAAWGQSGSQPGAADALQFFNAYASTTPEGENAIGVSFEGGSLGNPNLKPERSSEIEFGFDAGFLQDRLGVSLTYYDKRTEDALVFREVAPSLGATSGRWENLAQTRNWGIEGALNARVLARDNFRFGLTATASYNHNELISLGEGVAPISLGGGRQRHVEGYPLGGYWLPTITSFEDANGDGIIAASEVAVTDTAVFLGEVIPPLQATVQPSLNLFDRVRITGLLDIRHGHKLYNFTEGFRCNLADSRARQDITTPFEEQARCVAHALLGVAGGQVYDAGFTKLREVSLTYSIPGSWTAAAGIREASITLAGRNLATWTDYPGVAPDVNSRGINFTTLDFFQPAPTRHWVVRVNMTF